MNLHSVPLKVETDGWAGCHDIIGCNRSVQDYVSTFYFTGRKYDWILILEYKCFIFMACIIEQVDNMRCDPNGLNRLFFISP